MIVKVIVLKIVYVGVLMRLVSRTPGHVKLDWLPPSKVDRVNENNKDNDGEDKSENKSDKGNKNYSKDNDKNNNKSECDRDDKDDSDDNESDNESDNENWMYWCNSEASEYNGWVIKLDLTTPVKF